MVKNSNIEWCDHTFNPWVGCTKVSSACDNCYAEGWAKRTGEVHLWQGERRRTSSSNWQQPIKWNREAQASGIRRKVFCASLADVFDNQVPTRWRDDLWHRIDQTPELDWLLLTKRPQNIAKMLPDPRTGTPEWGAGWPNVWLGTTAETQEEADRRIPHLLAVPAARRFLSCEPLLGPVDLTNLVGSDHQGTCHRNALIGETWHPGCGSDSSTTWRDGPSIDWVIAGGESGPKARPPMIGWVRSLRDQCQAAGVPFFFKQWGEFTPSCPGAEHTAMHRIGKKAAGALLDGREWREFPNACA